MEQPVVEATVAHIMLSGGFRVQGREIGEWIVKKREICRIPHHTLALFAGLVAVTGLVTPAAAEKMTIDVSPKVSFAPARIVVKATIERSHENRAIEIVAESLNYYRSSTLPLDGEHAAKTTSVQFPSLPRGTYRVTARLLGAADALRAIVSNSVVVTAPEARVPNGILNRDPRSNRDWRRGNTYGLWHGWHVLALVGKVEVVATGPAR